MSNVGSLKPLTSLIACASSTVTRFIHSAWDLGARSETFPRATTSSGKLAQTQNNKENKLIYLAILLANLAESPTHCLPSDITIARTKGRFFYCVPRVKTQESKKIGT
jgi:hypothetical protein